MAGVKGGLTRRTVMASGLLALITGGAFAALLLSIADLRAAARLARHSQEQLVAVGLLEKLLVDLETGQRGFVITGEERFLEPWEAARTRFPEEASRLARSADDPEQAGRARRIAQAGTSYIQEYSVPLVNAVRQHDDAARSVAATEEGKRRIDALRGEFDRFETTERAVNAARQESTDADSQRATLAAGSGFVGSILLIVVFAAYLRRTIFRPLHRAAVMAGELAGGDLAVRMPQTGPGEIGALERAFNIMGNSLEVSRDELRLLVEEQAALRRVATLVARAVSPGEVFAAVAAEVGRLLGADATALLRYEPDGSAIVVAGSPTLEMPSGTRFTLEGESIAASVLRTGGAARMDTYEGASGSIAAHLRARGVRSGVGEGIVVEGRLWGVIIVWTQQEPLPADIEGRLAQFTELVGTAIANADSRAELTASRARVVAAADETRRRIERDLHDGTQQRLVSLALELRTAEASVPPGLDELKAQLSDAARGLAGAVEDLQEFSRGIHPAILSRGGLGPALKMLARRSAVPVALAVSAERRLPDGVEAAAYYVVSEALTNAAKHAHASVVHVELEADEAIVRLSIRDDGVGGADPGQGSGLVGLRDRIEALGGKIEIASPAGHGTTLLVTIPIEGVP